MPNPVQYRIGMFAIVVLIFCASVADLLTLIPFVGTFIGPFYWISVSIFLYTKGFGILNLRRFATSAISMIGEMVPVIQSLPLIIAGTLAVIIMSRIEDKKGIKMLPSPNKQSLNQEGIRQPSIGPTEDENLDENQVEEAPQKAPRQPLNIGGTRRPQ